MTRTEAAGTPCICEVSSTSDGRLGVHLGGDWVIRATRPSRDKVLEAMGEGVKSLTFVTDTLGPGTAPSWCFSAESCQEAEARHIPVDAAGLPAGVRRLLDLASAVPEREGDRRADRRDPLLARIGKAVPWAPRKGCATP